MGEAGHAFLFGVRWPQREMATVASSGGRRRGTRRQASTTVIREGAPVVLLHGGGDEVTHAGRKNDRIAGRRPAREATFTLNEGGGARPPILRGGWSRSSRQTSQRANSRGRPLGRLRRPQLDAISGASAGCLVSIFLHPVDTIKVLVQTELAAGSGSRNLTQICKQLLSKSGGPRRLYLGLAANLASSIPISAIYTSSYEAAKHGLAKLSCSRSNAEGEGCPPPPDSWVGHCLAGATASLCTSFVYTPSECVKNRVQAGLHPSSLSALYHVVTKEGPLTLYRAWPAVVLRNVPQSVVKFFAYEQLKLLVSRQAGRNPTTGEMLAIGGLAGASGALFSTPFDVVKTRMQTQVGRGSHMSLGRTMGSLVAREGVSGLYRGLAPRIFIYLSQGAIFFTAYEILKSGLYKLDEGRSGRGEDQGGHQEETRG